MKFKINIFSASIAVMILSLGMVSCGGDATGDAVLSRMDSLQKVADTKTQQYDDLSMFMNTIAQSLDSIAEMQKVSASTVRRAIRMIGNGHSTQKGGN